MRWIQNANCAIGFNADLTGFEGDMSGFEGNVRSNTKQATRKCRIAS